MISHPVRSDPRFLHIREHATNTNNAIINTNTNKNTGWQHLVWSDPWLPHVRAHNKLTISGIALDVGIFEKALSKIGAHRPKDLLSKRDQTQCHNSTKSGAGQAD